MNIRKMSGSDTRQKRFATEAESILYAQSRVKQYGKQSTVIRFQLNGNVTYKVYHGKSRTTPFEDCRTGEGFRPLGWIYSYQPNHFSKAPEDFYENLNTKSESFKINPDGTLESLTASKALPIPPIKSNGTLELITTETLECLVTPSAS